MKLHRLIAPKGGPTKLFVGGLHGTESVYTAPILEILATEEIYTGEVIIVPCLVEKSKYIAVLSEEYYQSKEGTELLRLIHDYKPDFYFELHAYGEQSYSRLTDPEREIKIGVPPFVDLGNGILLGSIAPILRREFSEHDFCVTIEVPNWKCEKAEIKEELLQILRIGLTIATKREALEKLRIRYPAQMNKAELLIQQYYRNRLKPF
ncbi:hypothetical protein C5S36_12610 [Candidatus Methanophagaceae archaeon]|nr:hypothetical protein C5S36_12610 [Methanophagales archaeon]